MTRDPSSSVYIVWLVLSKSRCWSTESLSWLILCLSVFCICFCLCLFFLYIVLFFSVRLEVRPSLGSLSCLRGLFLGLVVVVADVLRSVFCICVYESCKGFDKVRRRVGLYVGLFWHWQQNLLGGAWYQVWLAVCTFPFLEKLGFSTPFSMCKIATGMFCIGSIGKTTN